MLSFVDSIESVSSKWKWLAKFNRTLTSHSLIQDHISDEDETTREDENHRSTAVDESEGKGNCHLKLGL